MRKNLPSAAGRVIVSLVLLRKYQGAAQNGRRLAHTIPKGGGAYADYDYFSCIYIHDYDNRKKQKPPLCQVTAFSYAESQTLKS